MEANDQDGVYVFCKICGRNIALDVDEDEIKNTSTGASAIIFLHGDPLHAIQVYLDKTLRVRGIEYPTALQIDGVSPLTEIEEESISSETRALDFDMGVLIDSFGNNRKKGIEIVADLILQALLGNHVYIVHTDIENGTKIATMLKNLFLQETPIVFLQPEQRDQIKGPRESVFDLEAKKLYVLGTKMDAHFIRQLISQSIEDVNSFIKLQNELSKILYSYSKMIDILNSDTKSYTDTLLAREISIDLPLMPILLKMAEGDGIRVKNRVQHDGLGSALRSI